jgi:hypothetical protein
MDNGRVIPIDFNDPLPNETPEQYRERRIYEEINAIPRENKRYCYSVISDDVEYHTYQCKRVIRDCDFDFSIAVNSDRPGIYNCYYKPIDVERIENDDQIKMFPICYEKLKIMADLGKLYIVLVDGCRVSTGIKSSIDVDMAVIRRSINFSCLPLIEFDMFYKYLGIRIAINFPSDFPLGGDLCGMLCGGRDFDRDMTFQDPSVNNVFTMGAVLSASKGEDTTNGARDAQRHGRMFGRFNQRYENIGMASLFITEKSVFDVETHSTADDFESDEEYHEAPNEVPHGEGEVPDGNGKPDDVPAGPSGSREPDDDYDDETDDDYDDDYDDEQIEITEEHAKVTVDIDDEFKAKLSKDYRSDSEFVPIALRILKELEKPIKIADFVMEMGRMGYSESYNKLMRNIKNAKNKYPGYWNYSYVEDCLAGHGWIFMPDPIKDVLNAL